MNFLATPFGQLASRFSACLSCLRVFFRFSKLCNFSHSFKLRRAKLFTSGEIHEENFGIIAIDFDEKSTLKFFESILQWTIVDHCEILKCPLFNTQVFFFIKPNN